MAEDLLYSVRMKASKGDPHELGGIHVSGAENLVYADKIQEVTNSMIVRAMTHVNGSPDFININIELVSRDINKIKKTSALPLTTINLRNQDESRKFLLNMLNFAGINTKIAEKAISILSNGAAPDGKNMHGAIIMNIITGERYEPDKYHGVRVYKTDMTEDARNEFKKKLMILDLDQYSVRIEESLVSATKVIRTKGTVAEFCWPDESVYTLGYLASEKLGYVRVPNIKPEGLEKGGRIIFVNDINIEDYIRDLEEHAMLVTRITDVNPMITPEEYYFHLNSPFPTLI
jgi:6-carboxyhexanoate--CoA ligase